jgi:hypothetical protein
MFTILPSVAQPKVSSAEVHTTVDGEDCSPLPA